jgi:hypothetical protein
MLCQFIIRNENKENQAVGVELKSNKEFYSPKQFQRAAT